MIEHRRGREKSGLLIKRGEEHEKKIRRKEKNKDFEKIDFTDNKN
jgi:hypothetical protein